MLGGRIALLALAASACTRRVDYSPHGVTSARPAAVGSSSPAPPPAPTLGRLSLHFGPDDMGKAPCAKVEAGVLIGTDCPAGFAVAGPYAPAAAGSNVAFAFSIKPDRDIDITVDIISEVGKYLHAALERSVKKDEMARVALRARPQLDARGLEARIVVSSPTKVNFSISDLSLDVH